MIKTKTIATIGPASNTDDVVSGMFETGIDALRLNFSHGTLDDHTQAVQRIRRIAESRGDNIAIMGDLAGPKIRITEVDPEKSLLNSGDRLIIQKETCTGTNQRISTTYPDLIDEVEIGQRLYIADGYIRLTIESKSADSLTCVCHQGGRLASRKGINLPDTQLNTPALTDKDYRDLQWAADQQLDYLALSFVRRPRDVEQLRARLVELGSDIQIIAKIEKPQAVEEIDAIMDVSDGVLVARGDLGVEMDLERVPLLQKDITKRCQQAGKLVIIATEMLQSMVTSPTPTRAEVSDVANAIFDQADAMMLTAETAIGEYAVQAVTMLNKIAAETEGSQQRLAAPAAPRIVQRGLPLASSLADAAYTLADRINPPLVAVWTQSGRTARLLSKHRFAQPIIALSDNPLTLNQLALNYGVIPLYGARPESPAQMLGMLNRCVLDNVWAMKGERIVVVSGTRFETSGENNAVFVHTVGQG